MVANASIPYPYEGVCSVYANYGRHNASDFQGGIKAKELFTSNIDNYVNYGITVQDEDNRDQWGNDKSSIPTLTITETNYRGERALGLRGFPVAKKHSSINPKDPNPFIGGLWAAHYEALPVDLTGATHVQIKVFPRTKTTLIIELYDYDGKEPAKEMDSENWCTPEKLKGLKTINKQKHNFCLPVSDDEFKVVLHLNPAGKWQTLNIPLKYFVDWNKKQNQCSENIPGINEDIGNGKLDPRQGEAFVIQYTLVSQSWDYSPNEVYVGRQIKFLRVRPDRK
jgi:hypothetical protein